MSPLEALIHDQIARDGPLSVADYMTICLWHPTHGYYATRDPLGATGDFITAPEISQMYGELLGLWLLAVWQDQGAPDPFILCELGAGRGTLLRDALRATRQVPEFHLAMRLHLVEGSAVLRAAQEDAAAPMIPVFHHEVADLPDGPLFLIANEFFDALPVRQFQRGRQGWHERRIGVVDGALAWGLGPETPVPALADRLDDTVPGQIVEQSRAGEAVMAEIGARIADHGGAALIVDYGDWISRGDTLQAVRQHAFADPLADPGLADLTAHVAFAPLADAAHPARALPLTPQGTVLERLGITARAQALAHHMDGPALADHVAAHRRLTHPDAMGHLFKMLAVVPPDAPTPPGFNDQDPLP